MYPNADDHHQCEWHKRALALEAALDDVTARLDALLRQVYGKKGETMPSKERALKEGEPSKRNGPEARRKRRNNEKTRAKLGERTIKHPVPPAACACPHCGGAADRAVGPGRSTIVYEFVPPRLERQKHIQETLACRCGQFVITAPAPAKVADKARHGPGLVAQIVVARTVDSTPFYRQESQFCRLGIPLNRSTMCGLYHRAANLMEPIYACVMEEIAAERVVMAWPTRRDSSAHVVTPATLKTTCPSESGVPAPQCSTSTVYVPSSGAE